MVDEGVGGLVETTRAGLEGGVEESLAGSGGEGNDTDQGIPLVVDHIGIADGDAGTHTSLLVSKGGTEIEEQHGPRSRITCRSLPNLFPAPSEQACPRRGRRYLLPGEVADPVVQVFLCDIFAFRMGVLERTVKLLATPMLDFPLYGLEDEATTVLLQAVDLPTISPGRVTVTRSGDIILLV